MRWLFFLFSLHALAVAGQVVVEYEVRVEEEITPEMRSALPLKVLVATNGERVVVRGVWESPRNSYQLYSPDENVFFHCDLDGKVAVKYDFAPPEDVLYSMAPQENIAGIYCKLALLVQEQDTFPIYYTDAFGIQFCQIARVPGFAMRYTKRLQGVKVTYEAVKYHFEAVPEEMFSLAGRRVVESDNLSDTRRWAMQIGRKPPKFKGKCLDGGKFDKRSYAAKVLVVDINNLNINSGTPFYQDLYWFQSLAKDYARYKGVVFLSIFRQDEQFLRRIIQPEAWAFRILPAGNLFYEDAFRLDTTPATVVIHPGGRVAEFAVGRGPEVEVRLKRAIDLAMKGGLRPAGIE